MQSPGLALAFSLTLVGLVACGTVPDGPDAGDEGHDDADDAAVDLANDEPGVAALPPQPLSIVVAPPASTHLRARTADAAGRDVLVGSFFVGCGVGLDKGPFAAVVDEAGDFAVTLPQGAAQIAMAVGVVDVDGNGAFDASIDDVFVAGGYGGLAVSDDGFVELVAAAEQDVLAQIAASMLFVDVGADEAVVE